MSTYLLFFGFSWMVVAALIGLVQGVRHARVTARLDALAHSKDVEAYHREVTQFRGNIAVHAHAFLFSVVCIASALTLGHAALPAPVPSVLAAVFAAATVTWTAAALLRSRPLMGLADVAFLLGLVTMVIGLGRALE